MIFCVRYSILFQVYHQKHKTVTDNPPIRICVIKEKITFTTETGYHLKRLLPETIKLLGSTKSKITKDENGENIPNLEINEVVLVHCNIVNNDYQQDSGVLHTFVPNKSFEKTHPKILDFLNSLIQNFHIWKYGLPIKILNR